MARGSAARRRRSQKRRAARVVQPGVGKARAQDNEFAAGPENGPHDVATPARGIRAFRPKAEELVVTGSTSLPLTGRDVGWDATAADRAVRAWADAEDAPNARYGQAFFYRGGDGSRFGDYKLGFAQPVDGALAANWRGVTAVAGALQGARGGVDIPDADKAGIRSKVEGYYARAREEYDDPDIRVPWDAAEGESAAALLAYAEVGGSDLLALATLAWDDALALGPGSPCARCDHVYGVHPDGGACMELDCMCEAFVEEPETDADENPVEDEAAAHAAADADLDATHAIHVLRDHAWAQFSPDTSSYAVPDSTITFVFDGYREQPVTYSDSTTTWELVDPPAGEGIGVEIREPDPSEYEWTAIFAPEGRLTSDRRAFAPGSIKWRELPLTLMAMDTTSEGGHVGAKVAGRIDRIWRDDEAGLIRAQGVFDTGEYGQQVARLVADQVLRGVSVDLAIADAEAGPRADWFDDDGNWAPVEREEREEPSLLDIALGDDDPIMVVTDAEIGMTTVCPFPAFAEARIVCGDSLTAGANPLLFTVTQQAAWTVVGQPLRAEDGESDLEPCAECDDDTDALSASGAQGAPASWFDPPGLLEPTPLTVTDDGRVFGHAALWDTCHIGIQNRCQLPPPSPSGYGYFHLGDYVCDDGSRVQVGTVTIDTGHAAHPLNAAQATRHYDDTGTAAAYVRVYDDEFGIAVAGALRSDLPGQTVEALRGGKLSGDWRGIEGALELVALLTVNVPGFPVPAARQLVAAGEVVSLTAAGVPLFPDDVDAEFRERFEALRRQAEFDALTAEEA